MEKPGSPGEANPLDARTSLELEKLSLEIAHLRRPWWKKPDYLSAWIPIVVAVCALIGAWGSGLLDQEKRRLEADKRKLASEIQSLRREKYDMGLRVAGLHDEAAKFKAESAQLRQERKELILSLASLEQRLAEGRTESARLNRDRQALQRKLEVTNAEIADASADLTRERDKAKKIAEQSELALTKLESLYTDGTLKKLEPSSSPPQVENPSYRHMRTVLIEVINTISNLRKTAGSSEPSLRQ